jgi:hypothetical protein
MKWVEVITMRAVNRDRSAVASELRRLIADVKKDGQRPEIKGYSRSLIDSDFCIYLEHESGKIADRGSPLGVRLASALKDFGLVNHTVWIEMFGETTDGQ